MSTAATMTRAQKAAAILVAMGKPSASRLLKFFKQEELKALIDGARLLRTIAQSDLEKIVAEFEAEFAEGRRPAQFGRPHGHDPQRVAVARGDERADGREAGRRRRRTARRRSGRRSRSSIPRASAPSSPRSIRRPRRSCFPPSRPTAAASALLAHRQAGAQRNRQAHDVDVDRLAGGDAHRREPVARAPARGKLSTGQFSRADTRRQPAQRDGQGQARRGHAGSGAIRHARPRRHPLAAVRVRGHPAAHPEGARGAVRRHLGRADHAGAAQLPGRI